MAKIFWLAFNKPHTKVSPGFLSGLFKYKKYVAVCDGVLERKAGGKIEIYASADSIL
ncbi:hypothetical protein H6G27_31125 [Nostoc linckia FACHB-104]|nr:hypothetical protein [Nostoc linckia FACHB-104]